ncbi:hypothetical protein AB0D49_33230 [Streptomyces sp. NPDC048290]|uniref:hypothetical protein n=1 Tax=Streptomyces sp. NPDC048290 TaxID=3155811 RepID=UPI00344410BA
MSLTGAGNPPRNGGLPKNWWPGYAMAAANDGHRPALRAVHDATDDTTAHRAELPVRLKDRFRGLVREPPPPTALSPDHSPMSWARKGYKYMYRYGA